MRYIVYCTTYIYTDISGGNLRGEGRWERNVLDALVKDGRDVYVVPWSNVGEWEPGTPPRVWRSPLPVPPNLKDYYQLDQTSMEDTLFLGHSPTGALDIPVKAKRYVIQWFNGPDNDVDAKFKKLVADNPGSVVGTYNFPMCSAKLIEGLGRDNLANIHGPAVPIIYPDANNFGAEYLLWMSKKLFAYSTDDKMKPILLDIFSWCRDKLNNSNLKLCLLLGHVGPHISLSAVEAWFWGCAFSAPLRSVKDKVQFMYSVEWNQMDTILSKTKLIMHPWPGYGGAPYELSAFGVPIILCQNGHPFQDAGGTSLFREVLTVKDDYSGDFLPQLNRLFNDENHYKSVGSAYRNFVASNGSYKAYLEQLDRLCKQRGWM